MAVGAHLCCSELQLQIGDVAREPLDLPRLSVSKMGGG
eukprot:SAG11_NODE_11376_length_765_cov_0.740240_1_plen_37_part_10